MQGVLKVTLVWACQVRRYTFVVDHGKNMELLMYNKELPGCTCYFSPMSIYNLGVVDQVTKSKEP